MVRRSYIFRVLGCATALAAVLVAQRGAATQQPVQASVNGQRDSEPASRTAKGIIVGVVVNERNEPVGNARVHAFSPHAAMSDHQQTDQVVPRSMRASGSSATDTNGRFQISNLELGEYLVIVEPVPYLPSAGATRPSTLYAMTLYPSTIEDQSAVPLSALPYAATTIRITLVRVQGVRMSGSVVSSSGRPTRGMGVTLFRRIGGFGERVRVAVVDENGRFETPRVPPGWYRLTVVEEPKKPNDPPGDFATMLVEVRDRDITDLSLVSGAGASIAGHVVAEPGVDIPNGVGLRVSASPILEQYSLPGSVSATADYDGAFRMTGLSGPYQFTASRDRPPAVQATRVRVDGAELPATRPVQFSTGAHEVIVFVGPREPPKPTFDRTLPTSALVEQFKNEKVFWRQVEIAKEILARRDASVLPSLATSLSLEDRHLRGNAALIVAGLGDARGFQVITDILNDQGERAEGQGITGAGWSLPAQIRADRYYAAHLLGDLRDPRAISILVPLLKDKDMQSIVPWSLGQVGDRRAIGPLIDVLDEPDPSMRVLAIYALETLNAKEALPRLFELTMDEQKSNFGGLVSVADAAKAAIAKLK